MAKSTTMQVPKKDLPTHGLVFLLGFLAGTAWLGLHQSALAPSRITTETPYVAKASHFRTVGALQQEVAKLQQKDFLRVLAMENIRSGPYDAMPTFCDSIEQGLQYNKDLPSVQAAAELLAPWHSVLPPSPSGENITGGTVPLFGDDRIEFFLDRVPLEGKHVLELGPLEGGHSWMMHQAGAHVTGVEGSPKGYLKMLLVKETYDMDNYKPLLGNFVTTLEAAVEAGVRFEAIVAVGVLYHMKEPMKVLHLMSQVTDNILIWTHYYSPLRQAEGRVYLGNDTEITVGGYTHTPFCYDYDMDRSTKFIGGAELGACLLDKDDILDGLAHYGLDEVEIYKESVEDHPFGAEYTFLAQRKQF